MSVIRIHKERGDFAVLPSAAINDASLSWGARGMLVYLLDKPDNWEIRLTDLVRRSPAGRDQTRKLLHELEDARYVVRRRVAGPRGRFRWESEVFETPQPQSVVDACAAGHDPSGLPSTENPSMVHPSTGLPSMDAPSMVNQSIYTTRKEPERKTTNTNPKPNQQQQAPLPGMNGSRAVVVDLPRDKQLALELLLIAAPDFYDPERFVQKHHAKLVGHWARYVSHHPDSEQIEKPAAFIRASVEKGFSAPEAGLFDVWWWKTLATYQETSEL